MPTNQTPHPDGPATHSHSTPSTSTKIKIPSVKGEIYKYMMLTRAKSQQYTTFSSSSFYTPHTENEIEQDDSPSVVLARKIQFNFFSNSYFF